MQPVVFDEDEGLLDQGDVEPGTASPSAEERGELAKLISMAESLDSRRAEDPKVARLLKVLKGLLQEGAKPVIFCRFIATAEALGEEIRRAWPKADVAVVTGRLPPEERRARVDQLDSSESRILVATDCLSEGINLQALFDAVVHYDLSWNPTRHQQRKVALTDLVSSRRSSAPSRSLARTARSTGRCCRSFCVKPKPFAKRPVFQCPCPRTATA